MLGILRVIIPAHCKDMKWGKAISFFLNQLIELSLLTGVKVEGRGKEPSFYGPERVPPKMLSANIPPMDLT